MFKIILIGCLGVISGIVHRVVWIMVYSVGFNFSYLERRAREGGMYSREIFILKPCIGEHKDKRPSPPFPMSKRERITVKHKGLTWLSINMSRRSSRSCLFQELTADDDVLTQSSDFSAISPQPLTTVVIVQLTPIGTFPVRNSRGRSVLLIRVLE